MDQVRYNLGLILFTICFLNLNILGFTQTSTPTPVNTSTPTSTVTSTPTNTATSTPFATFTPIPTPTGSTYNLSAFNYATGGFKPINSGDIGLSTGSLRIGVDDSTNDYLYLGAGSIYWDEKHSQLVTASPIYLASTLTLANKFTIGVDDSTDDTLSLGGLTLYKDEANNRITTAAATYLGGTNSFIGNIILGTNTTATLGSNSKITQAQNSDTGPFLISGLLDREVTTSPVLIFSNTYLNYSLSTSPVTALFKLNPIPVTVNNATVVVDAIWVIYEGTDAGDYFDTVRLLECENSSGLTQIVNFTTNTGGDTNGANAFNILSSDISRATYQKSWYIDFTMVESTALFLYDVVMQYHLE